MACKRAVIAMTPACTRIAITAYAPATSACGARTAEARGRTRTATGTASSVRGARLLPVVGDSAGVSPCMKSSADCTTRCSCCMSEAMSWNPKGCCDADHANPSNTVATKLNDRKWTQSQWHNNRAACESAGYKWYMVSHADNLNLGNNSFVCAHTQFSRVNQLGNSRDDSTASQSANASLVGKLAGRDETRRAGRGVNANRFLWTAPRIPAPLTARARGRTQRLQTISLP